MMTQKTTKKPRITWSEKQITTPTQQRYELWKWVCKWTGNPELVSFAAGLIKKYNVPERNDRALARAVQRFAQTNIKFFRERPERFAGPLRTILWGLGDCDDKSILIASILRSFRLSVRLKFIRFSYKKNGEVKKVSHVYPQVKIAGKWVSLESVHPWEMGVDPEERARSKGINPEVHTIGDK